MTDGSKDQRRKKIKKMSSPVNDGLDTPPAYGLFLTNAFDDELLETIPSLLCIDISTR